MAIQKIRIKNLLSFDDVVIDGIKDINCIVGKNNVGKSNLLKALRYFYAKLNNERVLPPSLYSNYNSHGSISISFDTSRIKRIVTGKNNNSPFLKHIYNTLFKGQSRSKFSSDYQSQSSIELTLTIFNNDSIKWSVKDENVRKIIFILYPFVDIETRHIDLYDWNKIWGLIGQLSSFNVNKVDGNDVIDYLDEKISNGRGNYKDYISKIESIIDAKTYSYRDKVLGYIKVGLKGHDFTNSGQDLGIQSDGTNSHKYIEIILKLLIVLTRREYITPTIYIDEPEVGLHPKMSEDLIYSFYDIYTSFLKTTEVKEAGKYKTPYPKVIFSTHSPNILKSVVRLFKEKQQIIHFSKDSQSGTRAIKLNSQYDDARFLNVFSDNEARLFFSSFILFVEGVTEIEIFRNYKLCSRFKFLNEIDVYETNDVVLKYINPSYSKAAIPFLVVNDADVLIKFDYLNKKLTLDTAKYNINKLSKDSLCKFFSYEHLRRKKLIDAIIKYDGKVVDFDNIKIGFDKFSINGYLRMINEVLDGENGFLTNTTIEGTLINDKSILLFEKWIRNKFLNEMKFIGKNPAPTRMFESYKRDIASGRKTVTEVVNKVIGLDYVDCELSEADLTFIRTVTRAHLKNMKKDIFSYSKSCKVILNLIRVVFEGKTDSLLSRHHDKYTSTLDSGFVDLVKLVRTEYLQCLNPIMGKTGGWVTDFLDFSIDQIDSKSRSSQDFSRRFSLVFPELYDIIKKVSSSIA